MEYGFSPARGVPEPTFSAPNRAQQLRARISSSGVTVVPRIDRSDETAWLVHIRLARYGRQEALAPVGAATPQLDAGRVELVHGDVREWYTNSERGLKQWFEITSSPPGDGPLWLDLDLTTELAAQVSSDRQALTFFVGNTAVLQYAGLIVVDAAGQSVDAEIDLTAEAIRLVVFDAGATYPITVDPLLSSPDWSEDGDQAEAQFGWAVSTAGDVNGDGYSDVIIGAHQFDAGETDEGRAFVYHGAAAGLGTTPAWTAEGDQADALFGRSVSTAGDVNADGFDDVIVGSRSANGEDKEGHAFVYHGSATGLSTTANWTVESDQVDAELGLQVSTAGDVNGDGHADVIVGVPFFDNGATDEGQARVYLGSATGLATTADWTVEGNQSGAFFGRSVSTAGDVNGDGYSDVIVGAPRFNVIFGNEGKAFVYLGSATGLEQGPAWDVAPPGLGMEVQFGFSVSTAGDVNGDGYAEVIVGAPFFDKGHTDEGRAFLYMGSASGPNVNFAWSAESDQNGAQFGGSVGTAGDVNGDGLADVAVGAHNYNNGASGEGRAYLFLGAAAGLETTAAWTTEGGQAGANLGRSVRTAGDVNGDGFGDLVIGADKYDSGENDEGQAFVFLGRALWPAATASWTGEGNQSDAELGIAVSTAGDVNGDGFCDVIVGAANFDVGGLDDGRAFVFHGSASGPTTTAAWMTSGTHSGEHYGAAVSMAGDVNGDGYSDVIVGAPDFSGPEVGEGRAQLYLGSAGGLASTPVWTGEGNQAGSQYGAAVGAAGDVNGDGLGDVIVGAVGYDASAADTGAAHVYYGTPSGLTASPAWHIDGDQADSGFGVAVGSAGDVNADGYSDVIIGADRYDSGQTDEGKVWVFHGSGAGLAMTANWAAEGQQDSAHFGRAAATAGDVNDDGFSDVIVGAPDFDRIFGDEGQVSVFLGSAGGLGASPSWTAGPPGLVAATAFGGAVATAGDVNGDGFSDVLVGARLFDGSHADQGKVYLYRGASTGLGAGPAWSAEGGQSGAELGGAVSSAGDVNGDGMADVLAGAFRYANGQVGEGGAFVWLGNAGGLDRIPRQARADGTAPIDTLGRADSETSFRLRARGRTPEGRGWLSLEWEVKPLGTSFDGTGLGMSTSSADTGLPAAGVGSAVNLEESVTGLAADTAYHWRLRWITLNPFFPRSPWFSPSYNGRQESDLRSGLDDPPPVAVCRDVEVAEENCMGDATAAQVDGGSFDPEGENVTLSLSPTGPYSVGATQVTLTVIDPQGQTDTCTATVTVLDFEPPEATCFPETISANSNCQGVVPDLSGNVVATDNCTSGNDFVITQDPVPGSLLDLGQHSVTVTVTDEGGNGTNCNVALFVQDTTPPQVTCPSGPSAAADTNCKAVVPNVLGGVSVSDNCSAAQDINLSQSPVAGTLVGLGATTITVTAIDASGNSADCSTTFTVTDDADPSATCPGTSNAAADANCQAPVPDVTSSVTASDNCSAAVDLVVTQVPAAGTLVGLGTTNITVTVADEAGNSTTCATDFVVADETAPNVGCSNRVTGSANSSCQGTIPDVTDSVIATDNCTASAALVIQQSPAPGTAVGLGEHTITITATDAAGNQGTCQTIFVLEDTTSPAILCPSGSRGDADASCEASVPDVTGGVFATDNCSSAAELTILQDPLAGTIVGLGVHVIQVTVRDAAGNTSMCNTTFTVEDNGAPEVTCPAPTSAVAALDCEVGIPDVTPDVVATDNCTAAASLVVTQTPAPGTLVGLGAHTITIEVTDAAGNTASCTTTFTFLDESAPTAECPASMTASANASCLAPVPDIVAEVTATDNCTAAADLVITQIPEVGTLVGLGTHTITVTAVDGSGNAGECTTEFAVEDTSVPAIICPPSSGADADESCSAPAPDLRGDAFATDNCTSSPELVFVQTPAPGSPLGLGRHTITVTVTDAAGNGNSCDSAFTVRDRSPPVADCPERVATPADAACQATAPDLSAHIAPTDNCSAPENITVQQIPPAGTVLALGEHTAIVSLVDEAGNSTLCEVVIDVEDQEAPSATCPGPQAAGAGADCTAPVPDLRNLVIATDNCSAPDELTVTQSPAPGVGLGLGTHSVTLVVRDAAQNAAACMVMFTVEDRTAPQARCPEETALAAGPGCSAIVPDLRGSVTVTDNCAAREDLLMVQSPSPGSVVGLGTHAVTIIVSDVAGNGAACMTTIVVADQTPPDLECPDPQTLTASPDCRALTPDLAAAVAASDNCTAAGDLTISQDPPVGTSLGLGTHDVTVRATDLAGNTAECVTMLTVVDAAPPVLDCTRPVTVGVGADCRAVLPELLSRVAAVDNCSSALSSEQVPAVGTELDIGDYDVMLIVRDEVGNESACDVTVLIRDITAPDVACPEPVSVTADVNCQSIVPDFLAGASATDNCSPVETLSFAQSPPAGSVVGPGPHAITISATDEAGNIGMCEVTFTVVELTPPVIECPDAVTVATNNGCTYTGSIGAVMATDNCSAPEEIVIENDAPQGIPLGDTLVTWRAIDEAGNAVTCTQLVTVVDDDSPEVTVNGLAETVLQCGAAYEELGARAADLCDGDLSGGVSISGNVDGTTPGTYVVTYAATDNAGNTGVASRTVIVRDTIAPALTLAGSATVELECGDTYVEPGFTAVDTCDGDITGNVVVVGNLDTTTPGEHTLTYRSLDRAGNEATAVRTVTVADTAAPVIQLLGDNPASTECGVPYNDAGAMVSDACEGDLTGALVMSSDVDPDTLGSYSVSFMITDGAGNSAAASRVVNVVDTTPPVVTVLGDNPLSLSCGDTYQEAGATAVDACTGDMTGAIEIAGTVDTSTAGSYTVSYSVADPFGNVGVASRQVVILDLVPPVLTLLGDNPATAECGSEYVDAGATALDACAGDLTESIVVEGSVNTAVPGTYTLTYRIQDPGGIPSVATRTVEVVDSTPPVLECVEEITLEAADNCGALSDVPIPTTSDNCSAPEAIVLQNDAPDSLPVGTTPVRWTARDEAGNEAECTILVVVEDRVAPTLTCPADIDIEADSRSGDTAVVTFEPTANDNCDPAPRVVCGPASGSTFGIGTTTVICTATDASGNEAVCSFSVTVRPAGGGQIPGDCNQDGAVNIADSLCVLGALFQGIPERLPCGDGTRLDVGNVALLDWNGGGTLDVSDPIAMLNWLFAGGPAHVLGQDCQPMRNCPDVCEI